MKIGEDLFVMIVLRGILEMKETKNDLHNWRFPCISSKKIPTILIQLTEKRCLLDQNISIQIVQKKNKIRTKEKRS